MSFKEKFLKVLCFIPRIYFKLFNFIVDGEKRKFIRFMTHGWTILIVCLFGMYLRTLVLHATGIEPVSNIFAIFVIGLLFHIICVLWIKYFIIRFLGRGTFEKPANPDEEPVKYKYVNKKHK